MSRFFMVHCVYTSSR